MYFSENTHHLFLCFLTTLSGLSKNMKEMSALNLWRNKFIYIKRKSSFPSSNNTYCLVITKVNCLMLFTNTKIASTNRYTLCDQCVLYTYFKVKVLGRHNTLQFKCQCSKHKSIWYRWKTNLHRLAEIQKHNTFKSKLTFHITYSEHDTWLSTTALGISQCRRHNPSVCCSVIHIVRTNDSAFNIMR